MVHIFKRNVEKLRKIQAGAGRKSYSSVSPIVPCGMKASTEEREIGVGRGSEREGYSEMDARRLRSQQERGSQTVLLAQRCRHWGRV